MVELKPEYCQITEGYGHFLKHIKTAEEVLERMKKLVDGVQYENLDTNMKLFGLIEELGEAIYDGMEDSLDGWNVPDTDEDAKQYVASLPSDNLEAEIDLSGEF